MTPLQELLDWEANLSQMFDSDQRIAMAVLEKIRTNRKEMLEKEKEMMCEFAEYTRKCGFLSDQRGLMTTEELYDETFNTKDNG